MRPQSSKPHTNRQPKARNQPRCTVCQRTIRGRVHLWNHKRLCAPCKRYFSARITLASNSQKKWLRSLQAAAPRRSWLSRLFG